MWNSTSSLQINGFDPGVTGGDVRPPPGDVVPRGRSEEGSGVGIRRDQIVNIRKMRKISQRELIPCQETCLSKPLIVDIKHFRKLLLVLLDRSFILRNLHPRSKCELKYQSWRRWVEALAFCLQPLIYGGLCQRVRSVQFLVPFLLVFLTNVPAYRSRFCRFFIYMLLPFSFCWKIRKEMNVGSWVSLPKREMSSSSNAGTWPKGWILRKSGFLCSLLDMLIGMSWNWVSFSWRHANTLDTAVDKAGPYTFTGVAISKHCSTLVLVVHAWISEWWLDNIFYYTPIHSIFT